MPVQEIFCEQMIILVSFFSVFVSFDTFRFQVFHPELAELNYFVFKSFILN